MTASYHVKGIIMTDHDLGGGLYGIVRILNDPGKDRFVDGKA